MNFRFWWDPWGNSLGILLFLSFDVFGSAFTNGNVRVLKGHVEAIRSVALIPQVEGHVSKVCFSEGNLVKEGEVLYQLERERYQHQVDLSAAEVTVATFTVSHTQREYNRMAAADARGITQVEMDAAILQLETAKSNEQQAKANLATAKFDLEKTQVKAPIDGRIGASAVWPGSYVSPIHETMAQIVQIDPIRVVFRIPVSEYLRFRKAKVSPGEMYEDVRITLPDGTPYDHGGRVDFVNNIVNESDGTVWLGASFPNPDQLLLPNAGVDVMIREHSRIP